MGNIKIVKASASNVPIFNTMINIVKNASASLTTIQLEIRAKDAPARATIPTALMCCSVVNPTTSDLYVLHHSYLNIKMFLNGNQNGQ